MNTFHSPSPEPPSTPSVSVMAYLRRWINTVEVRNVHVAQLICLMVPNTCSSGYDLRFLGRTWLHIPPICKLNPFFDEFLDLRFRAADFLYEEAHATAADSMLNQ